jgi:HPt (histidine-containing phosphotransfer) domain-containing protein
MPSVLNQEVIDELLALTEDGDPELLVDLVSMFLADAPTKVDAIVTGLERGDLHQVERAAHSLKGSAGNLGASAVQHLCEEIQNVTRAGRGDALPELVRRLLPDYEVARRELEDLLQRYR